MIMQFSPVHSAPATAVAQAHPNQAIPAPQAAKAPPPEQGRQIVDFFRDQTVPRSPHRPAIFDFKALPDQKSYQAAVAKAQARVDQDLELQNRWTDQDLYLQDHYESILMAHPEPSAKGTVIMFHGYTAGPWQYKEAAETFYNKGYNVMVPRLPGHGFMHKNGMPTGEKMVEPWNMKEYDDFIENVYQEAKALGGAVQLVGLSGGSGIALSMAEKHPDIKGVAAMAPYLGPNKWVRPAAAVLEGLNKYTPLPVERLLDLKPYEENHRVASKTDPVRHTEGSLANAFASLAVGARVDKVSVPVQYFTTSGDLLSGKTAVQGLIQRSGGLENNPRIGWYHFKPEEKVPHAMASALENKAPGKPEEIWNIIADVIDNGKLHNRPPEDLQP